MPADHLPAPVGEGVASSGWPMSALTRGDMKQRFGRDFSHVVHTDGKAADSARVVSARASTPLAMTSCSLLVSFSPRLRLAVDF